MFIHYEMCGMMVSLVVLSFSCHQILASMGMIPIGVKGPTPVTPYYMVVLLDGKVVGHVKAGKAEQIVAR